jgi:hypothetical protein
MEVNDKPEAVNHPKHYNMGKFEVIKVIRDWNLGFNLGNTVKYIARAKHKNNELEDLEKALFYLKDEIENLKDSLKSPEDRNKELKEKLTHPLSYSGTKPSIGK